MLIALNSLMRSLKAKISVGPVGKVIVFGATLHTKTSNMGLTHKCEIQRIEEEHKIFPLVVCELQLFESAINNLDIKLLSIW